MTTQTASTHRRFGVVEPLLPSERVGLRKGHVLVTGGAGFLGSNLVDSLARDGHDVLVLDNLSRGRVEENLQWLLKRHPQRVRASRGDVRDPKAMREAVKGAGSVIHLAAQVAVTTSILDPAADFETNARGTLNVLEAVRTLAPDATVIFASTNKVYGEFLSHDEVKLAGTRYAPSDPALHRGVNESMPLSFHSPYGCSKGVADQYVLDYARVFGLKTVVFRMSCLYGPRQFGTEDQGWVAHFLIAALSRRPLTIFGDGRQVRDILYAEDAVAAYRLALDNIDQLRGRVFNLGGGPANALSLLDLLEHISDLTGAPPEVAYAPWRQGDQSWYVSNTSGFEDATGWTPGVPVADGLRRLTEWLKGNAAPVRAEREATA